MRGNCYLVSIVIILTSVVQSVSFWLNSDDRSPHSTVQSKTWSKTWVFDQLYDKFLQVVDQLTNFLLEKLVFDKFVGPFAFSTR